MGFFDYVNDLYSSLSIQSAAADVQESMASQSDAEPNSTKDQKGAVGTAQHDRGSTTRGGVSLDTPASGTDEESASEKEVNEQDQKKGGSGDVKGHTPGDGGEGSGQVGADNAGPHGKSVKTGKDGNETPEEDEPEEDADEEEEEEEDEPVDPMARLHEECSRSKECSPAKHHYDECVERVTSQHEEHGKQHEDCVEEFFHLAHCASQCAAPKLWKQLR